jgi:branched-chain amino acid aminotransferase
VRDPADIRAATEALREVGRRARVYMSMPVIEGVTPKSLLESPHARVTEEPGGYRRVDGIFRLDEVGISPMDHGCLYGDGAFEGILIKNRSIFLYREHMERLDRSLDSIAIELPMDRLSFTRRLLETARSANLPEGNGYIRLVVTRGMGDLGINPRKCVSPTVYCIVSTIGLYSRELYRKGIRLGLTRHIRRPDASILDPNIKSLNYLNNVLALLEGTRGQDLVETLVLTKEGFVAEATVDNLFLVNRNAGWENDPSKVEVLTPSSAYCLEGITRESVLKLAQKRGYKVAAREDLLPIDLVGPNKECFITGTGAGIMPINSIENVDVGNGMPGPVTKMLIEDFEKMVGDPAFGLSLDVPDNALAEVLMNGVATKAGR